MTTSAPTNQRQEDAPDSTGYLQPTERRLSARLEPFSSFWQAPRNIEVGYASFAAYYKNNYLRHFPDDRAARILVISCGPGYLLNVLKDNGYTNVLGIDSDSSKLAPALARGLNCRVAEPFEFLQGDDKPFDMIVPEQELNHLTLDEMLDFLTLCRKRLVPGGWVFVYGLNGANPLVAGENLAHNIDHFSIFADYSLIQILSLSGFVDIKILPLNLYVFWRNPLNYVGLAATFVIEVMLRGMFILYGKDVKILTKKIAAIGRAPATNALA